MNAVAATGNCRPNGDGTGAARVWWRPSTARRRSWRRCVMGLSDEEIRRLVDRCIDDPLWRLRMLLLEGIESVDEAERIVGAIDPVTDL